MPAVLIALADAIAAEVNAATWDGLSFEADRNYGDYDTNLPELGVLKVDVVPAEYADNDIETRAPTVGYQPTADIVIRKRFDQRDLEACGRIVKEELDRLVLFVEELHEFFIAPDTTDGTTIGRRLQTYTEASWNNTVIRANASRKHLREHQMFLGVIRVTYDVSKSL